MVHDKEFMNTLAKGLAVLSAFGKQRPAMTLSDAAAVAGLSRATARRVLRTLAQLGYVVQDGRAFSLTPRVLELGFAYLSGQDWIDRALPMMKELSEQFGEILLRLDPAGQSRSSMSPACRPGASCQPRWRSAAGCRRFTPRSAAPSSAISTARNLAPAAVDDHRSLYALYDHRHAGAVRSRLRRPRAGISIVDEELERGLRSIAVPVLDRTGQAVGAINLSAHATRTTRNEMREKFLPELRAIAQRISQTPRPV